MCSESKFHTRALRHIRPALTPWPPLLPRLLCSRVLITPTHSSTTLRLAIFISCSVHRTLCLALFCLITQAQPAVDSYMFTAPGTQADSVQNCPPNMQEFVNQSATIPQESSSHVGLPTIASSPLSQSESLICTTNFSKRSFSFSAPTICNEFPAIIRKLNTSRTLLNAD